MLPGAAALVLVAAQSAACIEVPHAAAALAEQAEHCIETLFTDQEALVRSQRQPVGEQCAALSSALADAPLPDAWRGSLGEDATAAQLLDLSALLRSYGARPAEIQFRPDYGRLATLLAETLEPQQDSGWWDRFLRWLQEKIDKHRDSQVGRLFEHLAGLLPPDWVVEIMVKGALLLLALLALMVVLSVLRDEGVKDWWRSSFTRTGRRAHTPGTRASQGPAWAEITALPAGRQAGALLRYVVQALTRRGLLSADRSQTNRELGRELMRLHRGTGDLFCRFAGNAEPFVYGAETPGGADLYRLREDARRLTTTNPSPDQAAKAHT